MNATSHSRKNDHAPPLPNVAPTLIATMIEKTTFTIGIRYSSAIHPE